LLLMPEAFPVPATDNNLWWWNRSFSSRWKIPFQYIFVWCYNFKWTDWNDRKIFCPKWKSFVLCRTFVTGTQNVRVVVENQSTLLLNNLAFMNPYTKFG
jgi:hypothetical protein